MTPYDKRLHWGDPIRSNSKPLFQSPFFRQCCICRQEIVHGQDYRTARSTEIIYVHVACKDDRDSKEDSPA